MIATRSDPLWDRCIHTEYNQLAERHPRVGQAVDKKLIIPGLALVSFPDVRPSLVGSTSGIYSMHWSYAAALYSAPNQIAEQHNIISAKATK